MQSPFANIPPVVKNLIIINIICFLPILVIDHLSPAGPVITLFGGHYFNSPLFRPWQIITYMFLHGGWAHIFFNMFVLFQFGPIVEYNFGSKRFFNFYFLCGIGAVILQFLVQAVEVYNITGAFVLSHPSTDSDYYLQFGEHAQKIYDIYLPPLVGASGAIEGVMVAFAMLYPNMELMVLFIPVPVKAKYLIPGFLLLEVYMSMNQQVGDNVAHLAHIGGAITGFILVKLWHMQRNY
jgi:membrane associated rhomboid family serine protease